MWGECMCLISLYYIMYTIYTILILFLSVISIECTYIYSIYA